MNFALFILLNAILLIRPEELFPEMEGLRLYLIMISICTLVSLPHLLELLSPSSLANRPVAVCVLLFFASTIVSMTVHGQMDEAFSDFGPEFAKVILFYFLLIANVDTEDRFRAYVAWLVLYIGVLTAIALAQQYEIVKFPNIKPAVERYTDPNSGETITINRMTSSGIFADPNDLCLVLGLGIAGCVYHFSLQPSFSAGVPWLLPIPLFIFALLETQSRGGLLGILIGGGAYMYSRFGGPKAIPFVIGAGVFTLSVVGGRQGSVGGGGGTGHERLMMWADGLFNLFHRPLYIPIGLGKGWFTQENGLVAHNSFVEAYVEFGLFGGGAFFGAFALSALIMNRIGRSIEAPDWVVQARHFGFASVVGYAGGCYSLTRNYVVPTYLVIGLASVLFEQVVETLPEKFRVDGSWFVRALLFAAAGLIFIKFATQGLGMAGI
jgi:hypothetical protein